MPASQQCLGSAGFLYSSPPRLAALFKMDVAPIYETLFYLFEGYSTKDGERMYEAAKDLFEKAKVTLQKLVELFVEAVARALAWRIRTGRISSSWRLG